MKYFCISDVHGQYDKMINALNEAGFNKETNTLVSIGDLFDRGDKSKEVLEFVMSCPNRLLCMGNHDLRLMQLIGTPYLYNECDQSNGVPYTLVSLLELKPEDKMGLWEGLMKLRENELLKQYFHECRAAFEFPELVITHGWVPVNELSMGRYEPYYQLQKGGWVDWRKARGEDWEEALWAHTERMITNKLYLDKTLLIGHWHAWRLAEKFGEKRQTNKHDDSKNYINCKSFEYEYKGRKVFIAIDGCSNWPYGGCVNVYQFETDALPDVIQGGLGRWYY